LITEHIVIPLELGNLPLRDGATMAELLGRKGLEASGASRWIQDVHAASSILKRAFAADYLVVGGGNANRVEPLPHAVRRGSNEDACEGGFRLWEEIVEPHDREPRRVWRVVR
jgi:hypothetical protein